MDSSKKEIVKFGSNELTEAQKDAITAYLNPIDKVSGGVRFLPLICYDESCTYKAHCPLKLAGLPVPKGDPCPAEIAKVMQSQREYTQELQIEEADYTDRRQVDMLSLLETIIDRCTQELSSGDASIAIETPVGVDGKGRPIYTKSLHPAILALEKAMATREKILKALVATRASKQNAGSKQQSAQEVFDQVRGIIDAVDKDAARYKNLGGIQDAVFDEETGVWKVQEDD